GRLLERERLRLRRDVRRRHRHVLGQATVTALPEQVVARAEIVLAAQAGLASPATDAGVEQHLVALAQALDGRADAGDDPRDVRSEDAWRLAAARGHLRSPRFEVVERGRAHAHEHLARTGRWVGRV